MREIMNAKQTQVHPCNPSQGCLRRLRSIALSSPGRIVALPLIGRITITTHNKNAKPQIFADLCGSCCSPGIKTQAIGIDLQGCVIFLVRTGVPVALE